MTDEELTKFSGEHLMHEFKMFWWTSGVVSYMDGCMHDALVESWAVHLRNLILVFCHSRSDKDDVIASDFFDNPSDWSHTESKTLEVARKRANKELSHLTEARKYVGDSTKLWEVDPLLSEITRLAEMFAAKASHKKLHVKVRELLKAPEKVVSGLAGNSPASNVTTRHLIGPASPSTGTWRKL